eukprot:SAG31_NODE_816_length_11865_cov_38.805116_7_plen_70_part_00
MRCSHEGPGFWLANTTFLVTGWVMIIANQQLGYYQANSPYSFFAAVAQVRMHVLPQAAVANFPTILSST